MNNTRTHAGRYLNETTRIVNALSLSTAAIEQIAERLAIVKKHGGRIFFIGVGGSAANCSHAVNDFRKLAGFEAYTPTDNVAELTARVNDDGWETAFKMWLCGSRLYSADAIFVLSVGGGNLEKNISPIIVRAVMYAKEVGATILGIIGRFDGYTAKVADACVIVPSINSDTSTYHTEAMQAVILHLLVSHPLLNVNAPKWESVQ